MIHKVMLLPLYFIKHFICIQKIEVQYSINSNYTMIPPDERTIAFFPPRLDCGCGCSWSMSPYFSGSVCSTQLIDNFFILFFLNKYSRFKICLEGLNRC